MTIDQRRCIVLGFNLTFFFKIKSITETKIGSLLKNNVSIYEGNRYLRYLYLFKIFILCKKMDIVFMILSVIQCLLRKGQGLLHLHTA